MMNGSSGGSCYGMSALIVIANAGLFPYSDFTANADCLYEVESPEQNHNVESIITYYHLLQKKDVILQQYYHVPQRSHKTNIEEIISLVADNEPVRVSYKQDGWGGHAVIAYDVKYGSWTWNGVTYQGCIETCDPNYSYSLHNQLCIYFNTSTYEWIIPCYDVCSANGAVFRYIGKNVEEINEGGYYSGTSSAVAADDYIARLNTLTIDENHSVEKVLRIGGQIINLNTPDGEIIPDTFYFASGESKGIPGYLLNDAQAGYRISQNTAHPMSLSLEYKDSLLKADVTAGTEIIFDENGYVSVAGEEADYSIRMIYNEDHYYGSWYGIEVNGTGSDNASLEQTPDGYILSSDNLSDVTVSAFNDETSTDFEFSTEYSEVLLYEIDEDTIGAAVDKDGDGTYETTLGTESEDTYITGDVDENGSIDISDATTALTIYARNAAGLPVDEYSYAQKKAADTDGNYTVDIRDATAILTYYARKAAGLEAGWS